MPNQQLIEYIKQGIQKGYSINDLKKILLEQGFSISDVEEAALAAAGPAPTLPPLPAVSVPLPRKGKGVYIGLIAAIVILLGGVVYLLLRQGVVSISLPKTQEVSVEIKEGEAPLPKDIKPTEKLIVNQLELSIYSVELNETKDFPLKIAVRYFNPSKEVTSRTYDGQWSVWRGDELVSYYNEKLYRKIRLNDVVGEGFVTLQAWDSHYYVEGKYPLISGNYILRMKIVNDRTGELLGELRKDFTLGEAAKQTQY